MIVSHKITMDLTKTDSIPTLSMMQHDQLSRQVEITLLCGEAPFVLPSGTGAIIRYLRSDGVSGSYDTLPDGTVAWEITDNVLILKIAPQVLEAAGMTLLSARLIYGQQILNTFTVLIQAEPAVKTGDDAGEHKLCWYLSAPSGAVSGQYLKIAEVDENGVITKLEAADVPAFDPSFCNLGEVYAQKLRVTGRFSTDYGIEVTFNGSRLRNVGTPTDDTDGANKAYVDAAIAAAVLSLANSADS